MTPRWDQLDDKPKPRNCGECGQRGSHHLNCPMGDGDAVVDNDHDDGNRKQPRRPLAIQADA